MIELNGRRYSEDEVVVVATGWTPAPYVLIAIDGSGVFVARRDGRRRLRTHRADDVGVDALAAATGWRWLPAALAGAGGGRRGLA